MSSLKIQIRDQPATDFHGCFACPGWERQLNDTLPDVFFLTVLFIKMVFVPNDKKEDLFQTFVELNQHLI